MSEIASCRAVNVVSCASVRLGRNPVISYAWRMNRAQIARESQHISAAGTSHAASERSDLCVLHYPDGELQRETQIRVGQIPLRERFHPRDPVGDRVAVHSQARRGLIEAR